MAESLHMSSSDYSLAVSIFFIRYFLLEVPSNMILNRTRPSIYLPCLMVSRPGVPHMPHNFPVLTQSRLFGDAWCKPSSKSQPDYIIPNNTAELHMLALTKRSICLAYAFALDFLRQATLYVLMSCRRRFVLTFFSRECSCS
jgi:hypothetical protein